MLRLIVFDCDGVMFDSKKSNTMYYNYLLAHFGLPPMSGCEEDFVHMNNVTSRSGIFSATTDSLHWRKSMPSGDRPTMARSCNTWKWSLISRLSWSITSPRYHLAISTNRTNTMIPLLKSYGLERYFGMVMTAATAPRPKPAPDGLIAILDHFGCRPEEAIFIGDSMF